MSSLASAARRLLGRLGRKQPSPQPLPEIESILDGAHAVAVLEACVAEAAGLSAVFPGGQDAQLFRQQVASGANLLGDPLGVVETGDGAGALSAATGQATAGLRATTFIDGPALLSARERIALAAARHLPLVIHLRCRAAGGVGGALGSGHEAYHAVTDSGCVLLFACNVQEAVDLALVARQVAERALVPALVAMDGEGTADSVQEVRLPSVDLVQRYLRGPQDPLNCSTPAQKMLFGPSRPRVPRWYDLDRPVLQGAPRSAESWALAAGGQRPYFADHLPALLDQGFAGLTKLTGRDYRSLLEHEAENARLLIIAQGSVVEAAMRVADTLRGEHKVKAGVLGLRSLRPLPTARLVELVRGRRVVVLERMDAALADEPPLTRELRGLLQRALENGQFGEQTHPGQGSIVARDLPRISTAVFGLGGAPLRAADLLGYCRELERGGAVAPLVHLGLDFGARGSAYPKREAMLDQLRRSYPKVASLGFQAPAATPGPALDAVVLRVLRRVAQGADEVAGTVGRLLQQLRGGHLRGRVGRTWESSEQVVADIVVQGAVVASESADLPADLVVVAADQLPTSVAPLDQVADGGAVVLDLAPDRPPDVAGLLRGERRPPRERGIVFFASRGLPDESEVQREERLAGAVLAALAARGKIEVVSRRLRSARQVDLEDRPTAESEARLAALARGFESVEPIEQIAAPAAADPAAALDLPPVVRQLGKREDAGFAVDSLPRFWNEVGVLYEAGETAELCADPFAAAGTVPPLSSTFRRLGGGATLPRLDPSTCTGCGRCWSVCPESAVGAVALTPRALLEAGIDLAKAAGGSADALRMMLPKLAARAGTMIKSADPTPSTLGALIGPAFEELLPKMAEDRQPGLREAFDALIAASGKLELVRAAPFFDEPEQQSKGSGELLGLAFNVDACKGCGLCSAVCEPGALIDQPRTADIVAAAKVQWKLWESLPDTSGETIARVREHQEVGELAALLLSRHCLLALAGGDGAEAGSGARVALRLALAIGEYQLQRSLQQLLQQVSKIRDELASRTRELLAEALPTGDVAALADGLDQMERGSASIAELTGRLERVVEGGKVDVLRLRRLVEVGKDVADLHRRLSQGSLGLGRARLGLVLAPDALTRGIGSFPYNPFQVPAVIDGGSHPVELARGLLDGQLRGAVDGFRVLRRARLELDNPAEAKLAESRLRRLSFEQLTAEERALCPPLLLVGGGFGDRALSDLLDSELPIKVLLLSDAGEPLIDGKVGYRDPLSLLGLGGRRAFVVQSSIAHPRHLFSEVSAALSYAGPAVIQLHGPSPMQHGFAPRESMRQARIAVESRAVPLLALDPVAEGVFGSRLRIGDNPTPMESWHAGDTGSLTPADWLLGQRRFAEHFSPVDDGTGSPLPLGEYLALAPEKRGQHTPFVEAGEQRLRISPRVLSLVEQRLRDWRTLQELAGLVTPFTARVQAEAERAVEQAHAQALAALEQEHEQRMAGSQREQTAEIARRVRDRLLVLAGYGSSKEGSPS